MAPDTRSQRWDFRVAPADDDLVRMAADVSETNLTEFVRSAARKEAEIVLADRTAFALDETRWQRFNELLERPPAVPRGLEELFTRPSVFE